MFISHLEYYKKYISAYESVSKFMARVENGPAETKHHLASG